MKPCGHVLALLLLTALPISVQAQGQIHRLVFTEFSDTVLTATLDGQRSGSIVFQGRHHWEWFSGIYGDYLAGYGGTSYYERPAGEPGVNKLTLAFLDHNFRILIDSGVLGLDSEVKAPNGGPGWDVAVFKGDTAILGRTTIYFLEVPEPGTFAQFGMGIVGLLLLAVTQAKSACGPGLNLPVDGKPGFPQKTSPGRPSPAVSTAVLTESSQHL